MSRASTWIRAVAAAAVLTVLVVAPPLLLIGYVGNPWPADGLVLSAPMSDAFLIGVLACLCWLLWAQLVACVLVEAVTAIRGTSLPVRVPGTFGVQQQLARGLVTAVIAAAAAGPVATIVAAAPPASAAASLTTPAAGSSTVTAPVADDHASRPHRTPTASSAGDEGLKIVHVVRGDSLWSLAQAHLGSGQRWTDIAQLNTGRPMNDGLTFRSADLIQPGWGLLMPADAAGLPLLTSSAAAGSHTVTVHRGDTLSAIAEAELGDAGQWPSLYRENRDTIDNPNLIFPDQRLHLPTVDLDPNQDTNSRHSGKHTPHGHPTPTRPDTPGPQRNHGEDQEHATPSSPGPSDDRTAGTDRGPDHIGTAVAPGPRTHDDTDRGHVTPGATADGETDPWLTLQQTLAGGGALLAAGILGILVGHRRRQSRFRRSGESVAAPPPSIAAVEKPVVTHGSQSAADVEFLDRSLRGLALQIRSQPGARLPEVAAARLGDSSLDLLFTTPPPGGPPLPWSADANRTRWCIQEVAAASDDTDTRPPPLAAYPTLAAVGVDDDQATWLLDLESAGVVALRGDPHRCVNLARYMAAELAVNAWSDQIHVTMVGFGEELVPLNPTRLHYTTDLTTAAARLTDDVHRVRSTAHDLGSDVLTARTGDVAGDSWMPHVLLVSPDAASGHDELDQLTGELASQPGRTTIAVVLTDPPDDGQGRTVTMTVTSDGRLTVPGFGVDLRARQLTAGDAADLAAMVDHAAQAEDQPMPASQGTQPHDEFCDVAGGLRGELTMPRAPDGEDTDERTATSTLPLTDEHYLQYAATTKQDLRVLAPRVSDEVRVKVLQADPGLDDDVEAWNNPDCRRARLRLLGPVELRAHGDRTPDVQRRIAYYTELVAYLATRDHGATTEQIALAFDVSVNTIYSRLTTARAWLGTNPVTGQPYLPESTKSAASKARGIGVYELEDVLCDADLFKRLRVRGHACGQDGIEDLVTALSLVAGRPFDQLRKGGYGWLAEIPLDAYLVAGIVDVAHLVATHALAADELHRARTACEITLLAAPYEDKPRLDFAAVQAAEGRTDDAEEYLAKQVCNRSDDADAPPDLSQRTAAILDRRTWLSSAS